jgi:glycosyltransferase involved in cell wall biosynthesis
MTQLVLHILPLDLARGAQRYARELRRRLDSTEVRHRILTLFASGSRELKADVELGVPNGIARRVGFDPRAAMRLAAELLRSKPAVIVAHGSEPLKYLAAAHWGDAKLVYYKIGVAHSAALKPSRRLFHTALLRRAALVAGVSQECLDEAAQAFGVAPSRLVLIPNGRDQTLFHPAPSPVNADPPRLLFVGHLTASKRPERFIEIVRRLREAGVALSASMAGDGPLTGALVEPAARAGVELLGHCSDVPNLLRTADVVAFTSVPDGEGMPGVFIEAGLSGVPVVSTRVPGASTVIDDGRSGFVVEVDDVDAFVERARQLLQNTELRQNFGAAARARCLSNFTLEASARAWQKLVSGLVAPPARGDA